MRLIDADALTAQMEADAEHMEEPVAKMFTFAAINDIKHAPTIEPKTGEWIKHSIGHEHTPWGFDCSECGEWFVVGEEVIKKYNYCPHCGASMENSHE